MSTQLDIVYKLKEALETGNPEVATPFMADDFTHQALPTQYVSWHKELQPQTRDGIDTDLSGVRPG